MPPGWTGVCDCNAGGWVCRGENGGSGNWVWQEGKVCVRRTEGKRWTSRYLPGPDIQDRNSDSGNTQYNTPLHLPGSVQDSATRLSAAQENSGRTRWVTFPWPHTLKRLKMVNFRLCEFYFKTNKTLRRETYTFHIKLAPVHRWECMWMSISSRP